MRPLRSFSFAAVVLLSLLYIGFQANVCRVYPTYISGSNALSWDIYGYYMYLPATIIHHDVGIEDRSWLDSLNHRYQEGRPEYQFYRSEKNRLVNVYPVGQSIAMLPFFLVGHAAAHLSGAPADGFSPPYQYMAILSGLFYSILGLVLLRKILLRYFSDRLSALLLLAVSLGTNLFYYASFDTTMPHNYLFAGNALLLWLTIRWHETPTRKRALAIGLLLGWLTITRPSELALVLIPLLWGIGSWADIQAKFRLLLQHKIHVVLLAIGLVSVGFIQLLYWKYSNGYWRSYNHTEGFDFLHPFTLQFLFSFKKGWLLYTPLMALAIGGFIVLWRNQRKIAVPLLAFFLINLWVVSSWECWWYATSFGQRPMVQSYGLMALPLGFLLHATTRQRRWQVVAGGVLVLLVVLNLFQMWQYRAGILSGDRMTKAYYMSSFGQTSVTPEQERLLEIDRWNPLPLDRVLADYTRTVVLNQNFEQPKSPPPEFRCDTLSAVSGQTSLRFSKANEYASTWRSFFRDLTPGDHVRIRVTADVFGSDSLAGTNLVIALVVKGRQNYGYQPVAFDTLTVKSGRWSTLRADFITPVILHRRDVIETCIWNAGGTLVFLDNVKVEVFAPKTIH